MSITSAEQLSEVAPTSTNQPWTLPRFLPCRPQSNLHGLCSIRRKRQPHRRVWHRRRIHIIMLIPIQLAIVSDNIDNTMTATKYEFITGPTGTDINRWCPRWSRTCASSVVLVLPPGQGAIRLYDIKYPITH